MIEISIKERYIVPADGPYVFSAAENGWTLRPANLVTAVLGVAKTLEQLNERLAAL